MIINYNKLNSHGASQIKWDSENNKKKLGINNNESVQNGQSVNWSM